ncbi:hypothetical protein BUALT_Bualt01G0211500 [Buddleja alternifolia]|uniref:peptidylprolyl isomerase n=1 Tax=Buddleja alternifolia TaxID=168488 RepID=A0AAV6Y8W4_9LAMI|nr:hypothetical protein BUALT_Bualt01G0211500 [Buddleja alternifolia]
MDAIIIIIAFSVIVGALIAFLIFGTYFRKRKSEIQSISRPETLNPNPKPAAKPSAAKKSHHKSHAADKDANKKHHPLDLNTLKGHGDAVTSVCFSPDARSLATACADGVVRVFRLDDAAGKSFKFMRINLPAGGHPTTVAFTDDASSVVVASQALSGSSLFMYREEKPKTSGDKKEQTKLPLPEIKWEQHKVHDKKAIITLVGAKATYGSADGSTIVVSCSEGTDIKLWHGKTGKTVGNVDTNQLKNTMATISPNGRFIAAAAFTADVKIWEIVYAKDGSAKEVSSVMQLKGHKSAVTWLCFSPNSEQIITASKDGSIRIWNINVRYHMDEDPKTLKVFTIPLRDSKGTTLHYDRLSLSPDGKILAATHGSTLQWLCAETGQILDTAEKTHDGDITDMAWAPTTIPTGNALIHFRSIEVKPGKPVTHSSEYTSGRLRISQATLAIGEATKKSVVQCNVGNRSPVLLCVLLPNQTESCNLDLEFEEADDVVFSVIGPRSVYLVGYYVRKSHQSNLQSDTESFGVDIENSQNEGSSIRTDDDEYEDSFIDDDNDLQVSPQSPVLSSKEIDEITSENDKPRDKKGRGKLLKKKYRVIESDTDAKSLESEDEEAAYTLSAFKSKRAMKTIMSDAGEKISQMTKKTGDEAKDYGTCGSESNRKVDPLDINDQSQRETKLPINEEGTQGMNEETELPKEVQTVDDEVHGNNSEDIIINLNWPMNTEKDQMRSFELEKIKKKRKRSMKEEKTSEISIDKDHSVRGEDKEHEVEASTNVETGANCLAPPPELGSKKGSKSKKRKTDLQLDGTCIEVVGEKCQNIPEDDKFKQDLLRADSIMGDILAENREHQEQQIDNNISIKPDSLANGSEPKKKTKKKMTKTRGEEDLNMSVPKLTDNQQAISVQDENQIAIAVPPIADQKRTLPNGLIIEELASGQQNGKVAAPGQTVKINYKGMLKDSGHVFDSNEGKRAFKFRLGDEEYIEAWNAGIDGMRVGDKRRLIIPPHLGFGDQAVGEKVPPNSWLVYDLELVSVRQ